jgi:hypothetical protein
MVCKSMQAWHGAFGVLLHALSVFAIRRAGAVLESAA